MSLTDLEFEPSLDSRGLVKADRPRGLVRGRSLRLVGLVLATALLFVVALCSVAVGSSPSRSAR